MTGDDELDAGWDDDAGDNPAAPDMGDLDDGWEDDEDDVDEDSLDGGWDDEEEDSEPDSGDTVAASAGPSSLFPEADDELDDAWDDASEEPGELGSAADANSPKWQPYRKKRRTKKRGRALRSAADADIPLQAPKPASAGVKALRKAQRGEQIKRGGGGRSKRAAREAERRRAREAAQESVPSKPKKKRAKPRPEPKAESATKATKPRRPDARKVRGASKPKRSEGVPKKSVRKREHPVESSDAERETPLPVEEPQDRGRNLMILVGALALVAVVAWLLMGSR